MKYYLIHATYTHFDFDDELLIRGDPELSGPEAIEIRAGKQNWGWRLGGEWFDYARGLWACFKEAMRNSLDENSEFRCEAKEITDEEAAMILFNAEERFD